MKRFIQHMRAPAAAAIAILFCGGAWAQADASTSPPPGDAAKSVAPGEAVPLPVVQTAGGVSFVTGGIPYEQIPAFNQARSQFSLNVEVYERDGARNAFTAGAEVKLIASKTGAVVLDATADGPYLWAKVPPGQYKLQVTLNGTMKESRVVVGGSRPARAIVVFPRGTDV